MGRKRRPGRGRERRMARNAKKFGGVSETVQNQAAKQKSAQILLLGDLAERLMKDPEYRENEPSFNLL